MNGIKNIFFIALIFMLFVTTMNSCKKEQNKIYGKVTDMSTGEPVGNVTVDLYLTRISSGNFSGTFEKYMSTVTDSNGDFVLEFEPIAAGQFSLRVEKDGYHQNIVDFMPEETASEYEKNVSIPKAGYIHFKLRNAYGVHIGDENDVARIIVQGINPLCSECCSSDYYSFEGLDVNEEFTCNIVAGDEITINRYLIRKGESTYRSKKYICEQGDTILYSWTY
ncbi:MAG: carboxypeptidase regulatory-like domain-containing protein [Bacteroidales bacterium]|jgi:5-hydroxyisourate hydrolase-like protein (transthyretin family)|nr:carboxypeptidase regulatory-like domain-containing protein [Bacteroidales bacterium]